MRFMFIAACVHHFGTRLEAGYFIANVLLLERNGASKHDILRDQDRAALYWRSLNNLLKKLKERDAQESEIVIRRKI